MITSNTMFVGSDVTFNVTLKMDGSDVTTGVSFLVSHKNAFTGKNYRQPLQGSYDTEGECWVVPFPATVQKDYGKYTLHCTIVDVPMEGYTQQVTFDNAVELTAGGAVQTIDLSHAGVSTTEGETSVASGFVRYDQSQSISDGGKTQACKNIGAHRVEGGINITVTPANDGVTQTISLNAGAVVDTTTDQTVGGVKTFSSSPKVPTPTTESDPLAAANKAYVTAHGGDGKQDALSSTQLAACNSGITTGKVSGYDTHVANNDIHVTAEQKTAWSGKQTALSDSQLAACNSGITTGKVSGYDTHIVNTDVHVTTSDKSTWNSKQSALTQAQLDATNSGITASKVSTYDGYETGKQNTLTTPQQSAVDSGIDSTKVVSYTAHVADTDIHVTAQKKTDWDAKYDKPSTGIPKTDLVSDVQASLGKADTAYQKPSTGIPKDDLASDVKISLGKADTALQTHQDISDKADTSALTAHTNNGDIHVTAQKKTDWDAKYDKPSDGIPSSDLKSDVLSPYRTSANQDTIDATKAGLTANNNFSGNNAFSGINTFTGATNVPAPTANTHAATKQYVDTATASLPHTNTAQTWTATQTFGTTVTTSATITSANVTVIDSVRDFTEEELRYPETVVTRVPNKAYVDNRLTFSSATLEWDGSIQSWWANLAFSPHEIHVPIEFFIRPGGRETESYYARFLFVSWDGSAEGNIGFSFDLGTVGSPRTLHIDDPESHPGNSEDKAQIHLNSYSSDEFEFAEGRMLLGHAEDMESGPYTYTTHAVKMGSLAGINRVRIYVSNEYVTDPESDFNLVFYR